MLQQIGQLGYPPDADSYFEFFLIHFFKDPFLLKHKTV